MKKELVQSRSSNFVYFAVFAVNIITFAIGGCWSWTSPIIPKLKSNDTTINPLHRPTTTLEDSWIAAIMNLGAVVGSVAGGVCSEKIGKKKTLLSVSGVSVILSHILCAFAVNVHFFLIARFLIGIGLGTVFGVLPGYVGDIAEDRNRGILGSILGVANCSGILFMYLIGPFLSIRIFSLINLIPPISFYIIFGAFVPESPYDLAKQGRKLAAEESLMKIRGKTSGDVQKELSCIIEKIENASAQPINIFSILKSKPLTKGLVISVSLMLFQNLSGVCAVLGYMQRIFEMAGSSIPPAYAAMLIGAIQLLSNIASANLIEKAGRKLLVTVSVSFSIISLVTLGAYFYLQLSGRDVESISWLPIASLITFIIVFNLGLANIPWIILAELFPSNVKAIASSITAFCGFSLTFFVTMGFPILSDLLGMAGTFWIFAGALTLGLLFCIFVVPETKGKSTQEILTILEGIRKI